MSIPDIRHELEQRGDLMDGSRQTLLIRLARVRYEELGLEWPQGSGNGEISPQETVKNASSPLEKSTGPKPLGLRIQKDASSPVEPYAATRPSSGPQTGARPKSAPTPHPIDPELDFRAASLRNRGRPRPENPSQEDTSILTAFTRRTTLGKRDTNTEMTGSVA